MFGTLKGFWEGISKPSAYDIWKKAFNRLEREKKEYGRSKEYWRIWYEEVCPAYRNMTEAHRKIGVGYDSLTSQILEDINKPLSQWRYF